MYNHIKLKVKIDAMTSEHFFESMSQPQYFPDEMLQFTGLLSHSASMPVIIVDTTYM